MYKSIVTAALAFAMGGCASIVNQTTHPMKIETLTAEGKVVTGAQCTLTNDYGSIKAISGETSQVRRSSTDLDVTCKQPEQQDASARLISRANGGMAGNIIFGGGIGAIIDHSKGTAYTYPTWVRLVFGKTLVFDRFKEKDGQPLDGADPATVK